MNLLTSAKIFPIFFSLTFFLACSQDQYGFISIDCGVSEGYTDDTTGIHYETDESYITSGVNMNILPMYRAKTKDDFRLATVRSFPIGRRNCYKLLPKQVNDTKYLIRAQFMYGNYDSKNEPPIFDLYLGVNLWDTVNFTDAESIVTKELINIPTTNVTYVCLVNNGSGIPFISTLELRLVNAGVYGSDTGPLQLRQRLNYGDQNTAIIRFPDDPMDRKWTPANDWFSMKILSTNLTLKLDDDISQTPEAVLRTALSPENATDSIIITRTPVNYENEYYFYLHFCEVEKPEPNLTRKFDVLLNGMKINSSPLIPAYLSPLTLHDTVPQSIHFFNYTMQPTADSSLSPIINALEIFLVRKFLQSETDQNDIAALTHIKQVYGIVKDWVADPCAPRSYEWEGIECSFADYNPPRVISLNLSSCGLTGEISQYISDLKSLERLDLSNNSFTGLVPDFLTRMTNLTYINLSNNQLSGTVPSELIKRSQQGSLLLSVDGNPNICGNGACSAAEKGRSGTKLQVFIIVSVVIVAIVVGVAVIVFRTRKNRNGWKDAINTIFRKEKNSSKTKLNPEMKLKFRTRRFKYSDVLKMTNNLEKEIGEGGFGKVYYGRLEDGKEVAVKKMKPSELAEGIKQFYNEAEILLKVRHGNLTNMVGYCHEDEHLCVIYEYMANGNLKDYLTPGENQRNVTWEDRLQIALDAAQGLEYLHTGCKEPIVHRDVKTANILLNDKLQAKFADFGISKTFPDDKCTHVTTRAIGTLGYIDPKFIDSQHLNEKCDVYGFGVVLLEIITGQPARSVARGGFNDSLVNWVNNIIETKGDVRLVIDPRLQRDYDINSAWKFIEIATACVRPLPDERPVMNKVVIELKQCHESGIQTRRILNQFPSLFFPYESMLQ